MLSLNKNAEFSFPNRSVVSVALIIVPLFPFPLLSIAFPVNGYHANNPFFNCVAVGLVVVVELLVPLVQQTI